MTSVRMSNIMTGVLGEATIRELENDLTGSVVGPGDPSYETARRVEPHNRQTARSRRTGGVHR